MKKTFTQKLIMLAVAFAMNITGAWAETEEIKKWTIDVSADANLTTNGTVTVNKVSCGLCTGNLEGLFIQGDWKAYNKNPDYIRNVSSGGRIFGILNLKKGDIVTINVNGDYFYSIGNATSTFTETENKYTWTVEADGHVYGYFTKTSSNAWPSIYSISVEREKTTKPLAPTGSITKVNGKSRIITLKCETPNTEIYYTLNGSDPTTNSPKYTEPFSISDITTVKAISSLSTGISDVYSKEFEAGTEITLNTPSFAVSATANGSIYNKSYTFNSDNSTLLCAPKATLSATFNGVDVEGFDGNFTFAKAGTLKVTASAEGYQPASTTITEAITNYSQEFYFDFGSFNSHSETTVGSQTNVNSMGCQAYSLESDAVEGLTLNNMPLLWKITANQAYGLYSRTGKGTIEYNGNFPNGSFIIFGGNKNTVSNTASTEFAQYTLVTSMKVFIPANISLEVSSVGWTTFCAPVDFEVANADEVYYAKAINDESVSLKALKAGAKVKAGEGVLIKTEGEHSFALTSDATAIEGNLLVGVTSATELAEGEAYILANDNGNAVFSLCQTGTIAAGKAYMPKTEASAPTLKFVIDDATAISLMKKAENAVQNAYNLAGQRIANGYKGIVIKDGKKIMR